MFAASFWLLLNGQNAALVNGTCCYSTQWSPGILKKLIKGHLEHSTSSLVGGGHFALKIAPFQMTPDIFGKIPANFYYVLEEFLKWMQSRLLYSALKKVHKCFQECKARSSRVSRGLQGSPGSPGVSRGFNGFEEFWRVSKGLEGFWKVSKVRDMFWQGFFGGCWDLHIQQVFKHAFFATEISLKSTNVLLMSQEVVD